MIKSRKYNFPDTLHAVKNNDVHYPSDKAFPSFPTPSTPLTPPTLDETR
jgi:hypothetical protein